MEWLRLKGRRDYESKLDRENGWVRYAAIDVISISIGIDEYVVPVESDLFYALKGLMTDSKSYAECKYLTHTVGEVYVRVVDIVENVPNPVFSLGHPETKDEKKSLPKLDKSVYLAIDAFGVF